MNSDRGFNRISTWNDRRLFSDFKGILSEGAASIPLPTPEELPIREDAFVFGPLTPSIAQLLPETEARREVQRKSLVAAGYHSRASWLNLSAIRFVLSFLSLVVVGIWLIMAPPAIEPWLLGLLVMAPMFMWAVPPLIVAFKASERKIDIERGLPDVLDMMNMGVSQGLTVPQSLKRISREIAVAHPALAEEIRIVDQQAEVGNLPQALRNFGQRIDSPEINSFTSLLVQSESTGTSISKALTEYSDSIRASLKERADARANAASFKLLFPVALFLMPSVFLFLLGPAIVQMSDFFNNQAETLQQNRQDAVRSLDQQP
jgi:tight adherence protein C